ncbi:hypothetical protein TBLA_0G00510 [Henningerozyma blattae CBS 6284]|uniref:Zn(2)-C6 fungal-type domain-containing protein n=1 Tax=Henningerozyma blattae (strain ATCC 34711 / CBS 6284 / DSM 70876 / NBRC 10599 / NRRL Y-10934 / UCD 77-7) TaxID=1071380 RepID=I2H6J8_HENB6|nr:hypothetical protein TBLA_0G00510 [Tetrapisispora blattae CBS 6284]CCH62000.1 hypothetical protein TBLA_0G00510 [Tetrapisispora blattae CBS 6284]
MPNNSITHNRLETSISSSSNDIEKSNNTSPNITLETTSNTISRPSTTTGNCNLRNGSQKHYRQRASQISGTRKKRKTIIKTCLFCREKKLKCDKRRPLCSSCIARNFTECVYVDANGNPLVQDFHPSSDNLTSTSDGTMFNNSSNISSANSLIGEIHSTTSESSDSIPKYQSSRAENEIIRQNMEAEYNSSDPISEKTNVNPLSEIYYAQVKKSGRIITSGPTSMRCFANKGVQRFIDKHAFFWHVVKKARMKWKNKHNFSMLKELGSIGEDYGTLSKSLITDVCKVLPSYEAMISCIERFFSEFELYPYSSAIDKAKLYTDFYTSFVPDTEVNSTGERQIVNIIVDAKKNYYRSAVIIMILAMTKFFSQIPAPIEKFLILLTGCSMGKIYYIERAQFLLLRIVHRSTYISDGGDSSTLIELCAELCNTCTVIGLNRDIDETFKDMGELIGKAPKLKNLWLWALYVDYQISFEMGKPMFVTLDIFNDFRKGNVLNVEDGDIDEPNNGRFMNLMKRYLRIVRPMLRRILSVNGTPDFEQDEELLLSFIENEFPSIDNYTDEFKIFGVDLCEIRILSSCIAMLICNYCIRFSYLHVHNIHIKVGFTKASFVSFSLSTNLLIRCFEIDKLKFPDMINPSCKEVTPYIALAVNMTASILKRSLISFVVMTHYKLTTMCNPPSFLNRDDTKLKIELNSLRSNINDFSLASAFDAFCEIFDRWAIPKDPNMQQVMCRSYQFVISTTLERIGRKILKKILAHRYKTENIWINKNSKNLAAKFGSSFRNSLPTEEFVRQNYSLNQHLIDTKNSTKSSIIITNTQSMATTDTTTTSSNITTTTPATGNSSTTNYDIQNPTSINPTEGSQMPVDLTYGTTIDSSKDASPVVQNNTNIEDDDTNFKEMYEEFWAVYNDGFQNVFDEADSNEIAEGLEMFEDLALFN